MALDLVNFHHALATWMAAQCSPALTYPGDLWRNQAPELNAPDPYSVLRPYDGQVPWVPVLQISLQIMTVGTGNDACLNRARSLFNTLLDAQGRPLRMQVIPAASGGPSYRINGVDPTVPGLIGRQERGRAEVVFNARVKVIALS